MKVTIYSSHKDLPTLACPDYFHSSELMEIYEHALRHKPYMVIAQNEEGRIVANMLAVVRNGKCRIFHEGAYYGLEEKDREKVFGAMLEAITRKLSRSAFYIEVSDISYKMFAYKYFKQNKYFPIHWLQVHNSLHSKPPKERVSHKFLRKIAYARKMGVVTSKISTAEELDQFYTLTRSYYNFHLRKFCPVKSFFEQLMVSEHGELFLTTYCGKAIGACAVVRSKHHDRKENRSENDKDAFLWFGAYKSKSHPKLAPDIATIWNVLNHEHSNGIHHFHFLDVGLPFFKNKYYDFIMNFGGKTTGTNRWFRFTPSWLNWILRKFFK